MNLVDHMLEIGKTRFVLTRAEFFALFVKIRKTSGH